MPSSLRLSMIRLMPAFWEKGSFAQVEQPREVTATAIARQLPARTED